MADLGQARERVDVENRHAWTAGSEGHPETSVLDVIRDDLQTRIAFDHLPQPAIEEILKALDKDCDRSGGGTFHDEGAEARISPIGSNEPEGEPGPTRPG